MRQPLVPGGACEDHSGHVLPQALLISVSAGAAGATGATLATRATAVCLVSLDCKLVDRRCFPVLPTPLKTELGRRTIIRMLFTDVCLSVCLTVGVTTLTTMLPEYSHHRYANSTHNNKTITDDQDMTFAD